MFFFPFENISYKTKLSAKDILALLNERIDPSKTPKFPNPDFPNINKAFYGTIEGNEFQALQVTDYKNSFKPTITGLVIDEGNGSTIKIKMRLHIAVIIFAVIWIGPLLFVSILPLFYNKNNQNDCMSFVLMLIGYMIITGGFQYENLKLRAYFAKLFEATIE